MKTFLIELVFLKKGEKNSEKSLSKNVVRENQLNV